MPENIALEFNQKEHKNVWQRVSDNAKFLLLGMPNISDIDIIKAEKLLDDIEFQNTMKNEWKKQVKLSENSNPEEQEKNWANILRDELVRRIND